MPLNMHARGVLVDLRDALPADAGPDLLNSVSDALRLLPENRLTDNQLVDKFAAVLHAAEGISLPTGCQVPLALLDHIVAAQEKLADSLKTSNKLHHEHLAEVKRRREQLLPCLQSRLPAASVPDYLKREQIGGINARVLPLAVDQGWPELASSIKELRTSACIALHVDAKTAVQLPKFATETTKVTIERNHTDVWGLYDFRTGITTMYLLGHDHGSKTSAMFIDVLFNHIRLVVCCSSPPPPPRRHIFALSPSVLARHSFCSVPL